MFFFFCKGVGNMFPFFEDERLVRYLNWECGIAVSRKQARKTCFNARKTRYYDVRIERTDCEELWWKRFCRYLDTKRVIV